MEPRELALLEVERDPWLQQRELATRLHHETGLAESTLIRLFRRMETEGDLRSGLDGRRKTYALPVPVQRTPGALWSDRLAPLGEPEPEEADPVAPTTASRDGRKPGWPIAAVIGGVLAVAVLAAVVLSPTKYDPLGDSDGSDTSKPVKASSPSPPPPKPKPKPKLTPKPEAKAAPKPAAPTVPKGRVAVLSGVATPGAAAKEAKRLKRKGVRIGAVTNAPGPSQRSEVLYAKGLKADARALAQAVDIRVVKPADPETAGVASGSKLLVVVGSRR